MVPDTAVAMVQVWAVAITNAIQKDMVMPVVPTIAMVVVIMPVTVAIARGGYRGQQDKQPGQQQFAVFHKLASSFVQRA